MKSFNKILIANRGEIAVRVISTARKLGYETVAVYSEADSNTLHVREADEAVCIGAAPVGESYLNCEKILEAIKKTGADAVHPGYGFLSENTHFAQACENMGVVFIGPGSEAIDLMGNKRAAKVQMINANVPCIPGYEGEDQSDEMFASEAKKIGFPIMIKAAAGGGGRGMRLVNEGDDFLQALDSARSEALKAFASSEMILEKAVIQPRHVEIQIIADQHGNTLYLGERDCSIQRRHQKVIEEAPSPAVDKALRKKMGLAAVEVAKSCDYVGAGTVEFLLDMQGEFYFLEMNTRLQVEHPITEMITGLDLVEWQINIAQGEVLPLSQNDIKITGHAIEARLYAEDPANGFLPQTGKVLHWELPTTVDARVDHGVVEGQDISPHYDPMVAKIIVHGANRNQARRKLLAAIKQTQLLGVTTNQQFLSNICQHPVFAEGNATTAFIEEHFYNDPSLTYSEPSLQELVVATALLSQLDSIELNQHDAWRTGGNLPVSIKISSGETRFSAMLTTAVENRRVKNIEISQVGEKDTTVLGSTTFQSLGIEKNCFSYVLDGVRASTSFCLSNKQLFLSMGSANKCFIDETNHPPEATRGSGSGLITAPMDGGIVKVLVSEGDTVTEGQLLSVMEAMKMEHPLKSGIDGTITKVSIAEGDQVKTRQLLIEVTAEEDK